MSAPSSAPGGDPRLALTAGVACYFVWGFVPVVFQILGGLGVPPGEILAHRMVWALPVALGLVLAARQGPQAAAVWRNARVVGWLAVSSALISVNWLVFIWAVNHGRILDTSLGYYINPLVLMALGAWLFHERLDRISYLAMALAAAGVAAQAVAIGGLPLVSITLALSFAGYGVVRKKVEVEAQTGLLVECTLLAPPALGFVVWLQSTGQAHFQDSPATAGWLMFCGPMTALPLTLFAWAARRMPLSAMAFMQFMTPTITFALGVWQGEPFTPARAVSFALIWTGAAVFLFGAWRRPRSVRLATQLEAP
ncbi:EamA family transporter RarD [Phenylobacterium sp.]|uniref:EamA family transporter RarD n=1 Tax=Phenylobacterium sp. TaxID=1871053 RepID=UPI002F3F96D2